MNITLDNNTNIPAGSNKRSSPLLKVLPIAVLAAVLVYFAAQVYNYFADPMTITLVYEAQAEDVISMEGWLVRTEEPLPGQAGTVSRAVQEGQRVAAGETVATVYSDDSALQPVSRIETLELQLQQLLSAGDYAAAESDLAALKAAVLKRDHGSYTSQEDIQAQIKSVESEIQQQKAALSGAKTVTAKASGTYSAVCDGYESVLTPEALETMTPSQLSSAAPQSVSPTVGKLIQGSAWYFAANVNEEDAASLKETSRLTLRMAAGVGVDLPVTLTRISAAENGKCLIVLKSTRYLSYMTLLREQNAELFISAYDGLRVPKNALRVDENGVSGVYCLVGRVAYFKPVSIVYQGSDYCLVEPGTIEAATESQKSLYTLRPNDEVIVSAGELYNGKVVD